MDVHVGCSGWFYSHWRGVFYPAQEVTTKNWFAYYANVFRTVELNAPFYRWPKPATIRRWYRDAPPGFRYTVKVNRRITHEQKLSGTSTSVDEFVGIADVLREKMGCFLFQFPPSFHYSTARLRSITQQLGHGSRHIVEFRHRSWWQERVYDALRTHGITFCAVSAPRLPADFPVGQRVAYFRLHGVTRWYRHDYTREELAAWCDRIATCGAKEAWVYFDNDHEGHAVKNAMQLRRMLRQATGSISSQDSKIFPTPQS